jgi:hypothetical protein
MSTHAQRPRFALTLVLMSALLALDERTSLSAP